MGHPWGVAKWGKMAKMADGMKMSKNSEKKMKKNEMVSDSAINSPSKMTGSTNYADMGGEGVRGRT